MVNFIFSYFFCVTFEVPEDSLYSWKTSYRMKLLNFLILWTTGQFWPSQRSWTIISGGTYELSYSGLWHIKPRGRGFKHVRAPSMYLCYMSWVNLESLTKYLKPIKDIKQNRKGSGNFDICLCIIFGSY